MNKVLKYSSIVSVVLILIIVLCFIALRIQYIHYKTAHLDEAQSILLKYDIISDEDLLQEHVTKEIFTVAFMKVLGATDGMATDFEHADYSTALSSRQIDDIKEMKKSGYFYAAIKYCDINLYESDRGIYPKKTITVSKAIDAIYRIFPVGNKYLYKFNRMKDKLMFLNVNKELGKEDFIIWMYKILLTKRLYYFEREKVFVEAYSNYVYKYPEEDKGWRLYSDEYRTCTYLDMHEKNRV